MFCILDKSSIIILIIQYFSSILTSSGINPLNYAQNCCFVRDLGSSRSHGWSAVKLFPRIFPAIFLLIRIRSTYYLLRKHWTYARSILSHRYVVMRCFASTSFATLVEQRFPLSFIPFISRRLTNLVCISRLLPGESIDDT